LLRRWRPHFRPPAPVCEIQDGVEVLRPGFFCVPALLKSLDGRFLALSTYFTLRKLRRRFHFDVIDAHFGYPEGYAAVKLGKWLKCPVVITLRGTEIRHSETWGIRSHLKLALLEAQRIFSVSESLRQHAFSIGIGPPRKILVVGNGVDSEKFCPMDKAECRQALSIRHDAKVLITVGALVERKGYHRVIEQLPELRKRHPDLHYIAVGGSSPEGDWSKRLKRQVADAGLKDAVSFLGRLPHEEITKALSAADLFVLATRNEGWANVILEAMACGLPVIATDVGGNAEVISQDNLGAIVPFDDPEALRDTLDEALSRTWDNDKIRAYACSNSWDKRVATLVPELQDVANGADFR
jgi:glycosyltransferase involved in cell wall biosynthesis